MSSGGLWCKLKSRVKSSSAITPFLVILTVRVASSEGEEVIRIVMALRKVVVSVMAGKDQHKRMTQGKERHKVRNATR